MDAKETKQWEVIGSTKESLAADIKGLRQVEADDVEKLSAKIAQLEAVGSLAAPRGLVPTICADATRLLLIPSRSGKTS